MDWVVVSGSPLRLNPDNQIEQHASTGKPLDHDGIPTFSKVPERLAARMEQSMLEAVRSQVEVDGKGPPRAMPMHIPTVIFSSDSLSLWRTDRLPRRSS